MGVYGGKGDQMPEIRLGPISGTYGKAGRDHEKFVIIHVVRIPVVEESRATPGSFDSSAVRSAGPAKLRCLAEVPVTNTA
jgi:hypothetical protein